MTLSAVSNGKKPHNWVYWKLLNLLTVSGHPKVHMSTLAVSSSIEEYAGLRGIKSRDLNGLRTRAIFRDM